MTHDPAGAQILRKEGARGGTMGSPALDWVSRYQIPR
jgi:hypothetical protein